jgi:hypothetical protein
MGDGLLHHLNGAACAIPVDGYMPVEGKVPAYEWHLEELTLGNPLEVCKQAVKHNNIESTLVVRDDYVGLLRVNILSPSNVDSP